MRLTLIPLSLLLFAGTLPADVVVLVDGTELEGDVLWRRDGRLALLQEDGTSRLVEESRVRQVIDDEDLRAELERRRGEAGSRAEALLEVALWAGRRKALLADAESLLEEVVRLEPELEDVTDYHLVRLAVASSRFEIAEARARRTLERNPNHERVKGLVSGARERAVEVAADRLFPLLEAYRKQRYETVLVLARDLAASDPEGLAAISREVQAKTGVSLATMLIDARFRRRCSAPRCENGMVKCPYCQGEGRVRRFRRPMGGDFGAPNSQPVYTEWCGHCDGRVYTACPTCRGTGLDLGEPLEVEKEELVTTLLRLVEENSGSFQKLVEAARSGGDLGKRAIDSYSILSMGRQAVYFLEKAIEIHPPLGSPAGQNLLGKIRQIQELTNTFLSGLSTSYMAEADRLYQEAVDVEYGPEGGKISNVPSRVLKLIESLSLAEESRKNLIELLDSDPAAKGFLKGDYQRRLELIDAFIERNRKALVVMRNAESAPEKVAAMIRGLQGEAGK